MSARRQIIATLSDVTRAEQLVDAHAAEVLREAADRIDSLSSISAAVHATAELRRMADTASATTEPGMPECVHCGNRTGQLKPTGDRYPSEAQKFECANGCREKATAPATTATPTGPTGRVAQLLDAIRTRPNTAWTTAKAFDVYRLLPAHAGMPLGQIRTIARGDLRDLAAWGHLTVSEESGRREYHLTTRKDRP